MLLSDMEDVLGCVMVEGVGWKSDKVEDERLSVLGKDETDGFSFLRVLCK